MVSTMSENGMTFGKASVWVHTKDPNSDWESRGTKKFARVPTVGEFFKLDINEGCYEVTQIVFCPFKESDSDVELFAIAADENQMLELAARQKVEGQGATG
jgi:hypothetical protein